MSGLGSFASIPRRPQYERLAGNFGHAGWLLIALDRQWYMPYWSSEEALLDAEVRADPGVIRVYLGAEGP